MSKWTHITACLSIDTFKTDSHIKESIEEILKTAPKITGSEGDAEIFVNIPSGYNTYISLDCDNCKYCKNEPEFICNKPNETYDCSGKYQSCAIISIQGDLRDRTQEETKEEFNKFLEFVNNKFYIKDYSLNIASE